MWNKLKSESGNTVIESVFIVTMTMIVVCVLILFGFLFYQKTLLQTVVNEATTQLSRTYTYDYKDPFIGYIAREDIKHGIINDCYPLFTPSEGNATAYSSTHLSSSNNKKTNEAIEANWFVTSRLNNYRFMAPAGETEVSTKVYDSTYVFFHAEIEITVTESYSIPLLRMLGVSDPIVEFKASSRALCTDMLWYYSMNNFVSEMTDKLVKDSGAGTLEKTISTAIELVGNLQEAFGKNE